MSIYQFLALLGTHWVGDFVLQTDWQAKNKSKSFDALSRHVAIYTAVLWAGSAVIFWGHSFGAITAFAGLNWFLHLATDYCTSRLNSRLWAKGDVHNFFVAVGFDQLVHQFTLALTAVLLLSTPQAPTPDQLYGCTIQQQATNGDCP